MRIFFSFFSQSFTTYNSHHNSWAQGGGTTLAPKAPARGLKTSRGIEGEDPFRFLFFVLRVQETQHNTQTKGRTCSEGARARSRPAPSRSRPNLELLDPRIHRGGFTEFTRERISALGSLPLWGNSEFCSRIKSLPGVDPNPPSALFWIRRPRPYLAVFWP